MRVSQFSCDHHHRLMIQTARSKFSQIEGIESLKAFIKDSTISPFLPPTPSPTPIATITRQRFFVVKKVENKI